MRFSRIGGGPFSCTFTATLNLPQSNFISFAALRTTAAGLFRNHRPITSVSRLSAVFSATRIVVFLLPTPLHDLSNSQCRAADHSPFSTSPAIPCQTQHSQWRRVFCKKSGPRASIPAKNKSSDTHRLQMARYQLLSPAFNCRGPRRPSVKSVSLALAQRV